MCDLPKIILAIESNRAYDRDLLKGISQYANAHGPWFFCHETDDVFNALQSVEKIRPAGVVVRVSQGVKELIDQLPASLPCVVLGSEEGADGRINVLNDSERIGRTAAEDLLSLGFSDFAFCGRTYDRESCQLADSFSRAIQESGCDVKNYFCPDKANSGFARDVTALTEWVASLSKPVGILAVNDERSLAVLEACKAAEAEVPEQVAVLGVDNDFAKCEIAMPPLSSIALNTVKAGFEAAKLMHRMIRREVGCAYREIAVEPTRIVTRQSTNVLAVPDRVVARALDFIRTHVNKQIQVNDVAESVSVSRRELERRFKRNLNYSIHQAIKLAKVQLIAQMLLETSYSISEIAFQLGFTDAAHIARYFRDVEGISPIEYRKKNLCVL